MRSRSLLSAASLAVCSLASVPCSSEAFTPSRSLHQHSRSSNNPAQRSTMQMSSSSSSSSSQSTADLYGIPNSKWTSPEWNWGSAMGTGHDCAACCRQKFSSPQSRSDLIESLLHPGPIDGQEQPASTIAEADARRSPPFEEVKLVLALAWQKGRWDGSDGGPGAYGDVLGAMAGAQRYETEGTEETRVATFVEDMRVRYPFLRPSEEDQKKMLSIYFAEDGDLDATRRICAGLVLKSMGFVEKGL